MEFEELQHSKEPEGCTFLQGEKATDGSGDNVPHRESEPLSTLC